MPNVVFLSPLIFPHEAAVFAAIEVIAILKLIRGVFMKVNTSRCEAVSFIFLAALLFSLTCCDFWCTEGCDDDRDRCTKRCKDRYSESDRDKKAADKYRSCRHNCSDAHLDCINDCNSDDTEDTENPEDPEASFLSSFRISPCR